MATKKKIAFILTVYTDGSRTLIEPDSQATTLDETNDPPPPGDGIETPPRGPGNP